jgi:serine/threonine protein kinase
MDPLQPGDPNHVGTYRLLNRLGAGGMGQVFLGQSVGGRQVAVKLIRPEHADNGQFRERFAREVQAARRVGGFHTAQVVDADPDADPPWMVTAYIPGPSLHEAVADRGPMPLEQVRTLGAGLAEGLAAIHACGLVHRDLKPGNVILAADGFRIIDFGIARDLDASAMTATGTVVGTYAYMSPEQVRGDQAGPASDVFSLGSVLAYAATGHNPFGTGSIATIIHRIISGQPNLTDLPDGHGLPDLITACLAKNPADRPTVPDILARLTGYATSNRRPPPTVTSMLAPPAPKPSEALGFAAGGAGQPPHQRTAEPTYHGPAEDAIRPVRPDTVKPVRQTIVHQPRVALDGAQAFVAATTSAGYPWLSERVGRQLGGGYRQQLAETRELLLGRPDAYHLEQGIWRVRLEDLMRHRPELTGDLAALVQETRERLRARSWNTPS